MNGDTSERAPKRIKVEEGQNGNGNGLEHEQAVAGSSKAAKLGGEEEDVKRVLKEEAEAQASPLQQDGDKIDDNYGIYEHYAQEAAAGAAPPSGDLYLDTVSLACDLVMASKRLTYRCIGQSFGAGL